MPRTGRLPARAFLAGKLLAFPRKRLAQLRVTSPRRRPVRRPEQPALRLSRVTLREPATGIECSGCGGGPARMRRADLGTAAVDRCGTVAVLSVRVPFLAGDRGAGGKAGPWHSRHGPLLGSRGPARVFRPPAVPGVGVYARVGPSGNVSGTVRAYRGVLWEGRGQQVRRHRR